MSVHSTTKKNFDDSCGGWVKEREWEIVRRERTTKTTTTTIASSSRFHLKVFKGKTSQFHHTHTHSLCIEKNYNQEQRCDVRLRNENFRNIIFFISSLSLFASLAFALGRFRHLYIFIFIWFCFLLLFFVSVIFLIFYWFILVSF